MALLSVADRTRVLRGIMRYVSANGLTFGALTKPDLYDPVANTGVIADTDAWIENHSANTSADTVGYNGALAVAMRSALTLSQKTLIFCAVASMRVSLAAARNLLGEVD